MRKSKAAALCPETPAAECGGILLQKTYLEIFWPIQMQMQAPTTEMAKEEKLPEAWMPSRPI